MTISNNFAEITPLHEAFLECLHDIISKIFRTKYAVNGICCRRIDSLEDMVVFCCKSSNLR
ncbi:hypothetical protein Gogos_009994 [Gossypium gossypioides]|uniref:Uncharacterized protein n=1 Tax=Gossypium gossypioides TaxID=34282 RepID=A0A7J9BJY2_GOSGO|nr:hypothetical protein [Gossypium gossypioides]